MLVVSHDRRFLDTVCERLWVVDDGQVAPFDGGYRAWRAAIADGWTVAGAIEQEAKRMQPRTRTPGPGRGPGTSSAPGAAVAVLDPASTAPVRPRKSSSSNGARLSKDAYRRQREALDAELTRLNLRKNHLELELSKPAVRANFIELRRVSSELADVELAIADAEDAWLAVEERAP
jgi:ATPase subunit of ABC transporter with duplicated ATPase domains